MSRRCNEDVLEWEYDASELLHPINAVTRFSDSVTIADRKPHKP